MGLACPYCSAVILERSEGVYVCTDCERRVLVGFEQQGDVFLRRTRWRWAILPWAPALFGLAGLITGSEAVLGVGLLVTVIEWLGSTIWVARHGSHRQAWGRALLVFFPGGLLRLAVVAYVAWSVVMAT